MRRFWERAVTIAATRKGKWVVAAVWLFIIAGAVPLATRLGGAMDNDEVNWLPAGAQSTRAVQIGKQEFATDDTSALLVVYGRETGLTAADLALCEQDRTALRSLASGPIGPGSRSADGKALLLTVPVASTAMESGAVKDIVAGARNLFATHSAAGLTILTTGPAASRADISAASGDADGTMLIVTASVVALMLLLTYRSPLLMFLPLLCVGVAALVAQATVVWLADRGELTVTGTGSVLLTVMVFGAGTDYALLLISRYRDELGHLTDRHEAMANALRLTIPTILASAGTVILALFTLALATMNSTRGLGPVAAIGIAAATLVMTTLLPAILMLAGRVVFWPRIPHTTNTSIESAARLWNRLAAFVGHYPRRIWIATALGLIALSAGALTVSVGANQNGQAFTRPLEFVAGQALLAHHFPSGAGSPVLLYSPAGHVSQVAAAAHTTTGVTGVGQPRLSSSGAWAQVTVVLSDDPDSDEAKNTVRRLRSNSAAIGTGIVAGGRTASSLDQQQAMTHDLLVLIPLILIAVLTGLGLLLRAIIAPLVLLACVTLSAGAGLGVAGLSFRLLGYPQVDPHVLLFGFLFLIALGVDYTIFLITRCRHEIAISGHRRGVLHALTATGGVITSAGAVLAATFAALTTTPVVLNLQLGLLVAIGVLLDTFIVRTLLVPALTLHIGPRMWWPYHSEPGTD